MMITYAIDGLQLAITLAGGWLLMFWLYHDYRIDAFRQRMFDLRSELFLYAGITTLILTTLLMARCARA